ncbi:MAG TPA: PRC-barrel domain-containing protein [Acetobacteraceae bacterium]|nr:PRC-barrel domain-containing protein [Acetobacteraceae bacterium]
MPASAVPGGNQTNAASSATSSTIDIVAANSIIGRDLRDPSGADAGTINSLVINTQTGVVDFVMVGGSGSFNPGAGLIALPWMALQSPIGGNGPITIKVSVEKLLRSPRISPERIYWPDQAGQRARIYGYYGYAYPRYYGYNYGYRSGAAPGYFGPGSSSRPARSGRQLVTQAGAANGSGSQATTANGSGSALVVTRNNVVSTLDARATTSANALQNATVYSRSGDDLGSVAQVMIDVDRGEVAYVLLSRGGFLGLQQRWFVLPIEALVATPYRGGYRLTADAKTLMHEPALNVDQQQLPAQVSASQLATLYNKFHMQPYWQEQNHQPNSGSGQAGDQATASKQQ